MVQSYHRETAEFGRSLSFFDAVYAFSVTLLVANLDVPPPAAWTDLGTLLSNGLGAQLMAYAISFVVIAVFWRSNQTLIARMYQLDAATIWLNVASVGTVIFIPFSTQAMGDPPTAELPLPTAVYAANVALVIVLQIIMFAVAQSHGLVRNPPPPRLRWAERADALLKVAVFLISIPIAFAVGADIAKYSWLALFVLAPITGLYVRRVEAKASD